VWREFPPYLDHLLDFRVPVVILLASLSNLLGQDQPGPGSLSIEIDPGAIIDQHRFRETRNACGPAALANSLRFGNPKSRAIWFGFPSSEADRKLRFAIDRYFLGRPSVVFPRMKRLRPEGTEPEDLTAAYREILEAHELRPVKGNYLDRKENESDTALVARLHGDLSESIRAGIPPILGLRSFLAQRDDSPEAEDGEISWKPARSHYVVVTEIPKRLRDGEWGFRFELIDPNGGALKTGFVYAEPQQPFVALKGNEVTGQWLSGSPFLVVQAPAVVSLQPKDAIWRDRVVIVAHHLIGARFAWD